MSVILDFILCFLRMCITLVYYGLSLNTSNLNGNIYLNCFFSAAIESLSYVVIWLLTDRLPRPTLLFATMMYSGFTLLVLKLIPEGQTSPSEHCQTWKKSHNCHVGFSQTMWLHCKSSLWWQSLVLLALSPSSVWLWLSWCPLWSETWAWVLGLPVDSLAPSSLRTFSIWASLAMF